jgi:5-methylthioadenosine/S-adenosylhomocysteine deaminase
VWVNEHELELIADSGATVVHCPVSNMYLASGVAPIVEMLKRDITVALATDGPGSNNSQDMFEIMKTAVLLQKVHRLDAGAIGPAEVLRMACRGGAAALGATDSLGTLAEGRLADIIVVDLNTAFSTPVHNTYSALVFNASSRDVRTVIVGGRVILRDGKLTTLDEQKALAEATAICKDLFTRAGLRSEVNQP